MSTHDPDSPEGDGLAAESVEADGVSADAANTDGPPADGGFGTGADAAPDGEAETSADDLAEAGDSAQAAESAGEGAARGASISVEDLVLDLERVSTERDEYLDSLRRLQAEFENYRKAVTKREADARARANNGLVAELLPVLDACDGAVANGADDVAPVRTALVDALTKQGLERIDPVDAAFDPELHEAVMHEPGGYGWKGNVVRPAMVRVVG